MKDTPIPSGVCVGEVLSRQGKSARLDGKGEIETGLLDFPFCQNEPNFDSEIACSTRVSGVSHVLR
jgi:hypothetical protein